eukprot:GHVO01064210.1.p1 GENE.GHVO01064210.1~~GHVO01064210.1.p1  ORF type:complete len:413 (+),score=53.44 GHVO01064210.1:111-1349(+)
MPASLLLDMNAPSGDVAEQNALQSLALELSTMELSSSLVKLGGLDPDGQSFDDSSDSQPTLKKSANMKAECVEVPTSEHVAEIVGRQGCKIKALRAKTNTYIRTPVRGEAPVFVVTGRKEDVSLAKKEILSAAEHFSQIRASRRNNSSGSMHGPPSPGTPGQVTIQVRVPYRVVGLVVGPKGATIKRIQQQAQTYIVTPSRDKEPIFEVTGMPDNVEKARREIENHIALRTGGNLSDAPQHRQMQDHISDFHANGVEASDLDMLMYKLPSRDSAFTSYNNRSNIDSNIFAYNGFSTTGGLYDSDEGIGSSPSLDNPLGSLAGNSIWSDAMVDLPCNQTMSSLMDSLSPTGSSSLDEAPGPLQAPLMNLTGMNAFMPGMRGPSTSTSPTDSTGSIGNPRPGGFSSADCEVSPW